MAYRGAVIKLPVGVQGFTGTRNPSQAGPGHLTFVDGVEIYSNVLRKEGGAAKFNSTVLTGAPTIVAGINWSPELSIINDVIVTSGGNVLKDDGTGTFAITAASGLVINRDPPPYFMVAGGETVGEPRKLFLFSSDNQVKVLPGTTDSMVDITTPPTDWADGEFPTFGIQHAGRVFAGGNASDPHRIYYTGVGDHEDYSTGGGTISIFPGEGETLVGGISFRGALVLFKYPFGIYLINTSDPSPANWRVDRVTRSVGALSQQSIVQIDNDVLYMDNAGNIHTLSATQEFGDVTTSNISRAMDLEPFMRETVDRTLLRRAAGIWYAPKRQAWFSVTQEGEVDNNLRIVVGFDSNPPRVFMSRRDKAPCMWVKPVPEDLTYRPVIGDNEGFIWILDQDLRSKDSSGYQMRFDTANTDLQFAAPELATRMKAGQFLEITSEPKGNWDLTVEVYWDDVLSDVLQFNMGNIGAALGDFTLDEDALASEAVSSQRLRVSGSGRRIRLIGYNNGEGQDVAVADFYLSIIPMDERIRDGGT